MPGGVHYLLGLFLIYFFGIFYSGSRSRGHDHHKKTDSSSSYDNDNDNNDEPTISRAYHYFKIGLIFGSVLPDVDVLVAVAAIVYSFLCGGTTDDFVEIADIVHRSATHTLLLWIPMVLLTYLLSSVIVQVNRTMNRRHRLHLQLMNMVDGDDQTSAQELFHSQQQKKKENKKKKQQESSSSRISGSGNDNTKSQSWHRALCWTQFLMGVSVAAIVHVLADTIYLKGVKCLWPYTNSVFFYELPQLNLFHIGYYHPYTQKMFFVLDHCSEIIFYVILIMYTRMSQSTLFKLKCVCYAQFSANFICFLIDRFVDLHFHNFVILLYFPGVPFLAISISVPLLLAPQIAHFEWHKVGSVLTGSSSTAQMDTESDDELSSSSSSSSPSSSPSKGITSSRSTVEDSSCTIQKRSVKVY